MDVSKFKTGDVINIFPYEVRAGPSPERVEGLRVNAQRRSRVFRVWALCFDGRYLGWVWVPCPV